MIFFNRQKKFRPPGLIRVEGVPIPYSQSARYLGIDIDEKLDFKTHITSKIKKAKALLFKIKGSIGKLWGPSPNLMRLMYVMMVRPMITYGSIVWAKRARFFQPQLGRLQRLIMLCMAPMAKSTPTLGLEVIGGLMPLDLLVKGEAIKTMARISKRNPVIWDGVGDGQHRGHLIWSRHAAVDAGVESVSLDTASKTRSWDKRYVVDESTFGHGIPDVETGLCCFTDGSRIKSRTGWGFRLSRQGEVIAEVIHNMDGKATVFQAEVEAIRCAVERAMTLEDDNLTIYSDSQAALKALDGFTANSRTVLECKRALNQLGLVSRVILKWVKAHVGHPENEAADELAKRGALSNPEFFPQIPHLMSRASFVKQIQGSLMKEWFDRWSKQPTCRQTKLWFRRPDVNKSKRLIQCDRSSYGQVIQFITGHNYLGHHMSKTSQTSDICRLCEEEVETAEHLSRSCQATWRARVDLWATPDGIPSLSHNWSCKVLQKFLKDEQIQALLAPREEDFGTPEEGDSFILAGRSPGTSPGAGSHL